MIVGRSMGDAPRSVGDDCLRSRRVEEHGGFGNEHFPNYRDPYRVSVFSYLVHCFVKLRVQLD